MQDAKRALTKLSFSRGNTENFMGCRVEMSSAIHSVSPLWSYDAGEREVGFDGRG